MIVKIRTESTESLQPYQQGAVKRKAKQNIEKWGKNSLDYYKPVLNFGFKKWFFWLSQACD